MPNQKQILAEVEKSLSTIQDADGVIDTVFQVTFGPDHEKWDASKNFRILISPRRSEFDGMSDEAREFVRSILPTYELPVSRFIGDVKRGTDEFEEAYAKLVPRFGDSLRITITPDEDDISKDSEKGQVVAPANAKIHHESLTRGVTGTKGAVHIAKDDVQARLKAFLSGRS